MTTAISTSSQRRRERSARAHAVGHRRWRGWVLLAAVVIAGAGLMLVANARTTGGGTAGAAPPFTLPSTDGRTVSLADYRGREVLLYFNEGVGCDICFGQLVEIERSGVFRDADLTVLPVVVNDLESTQQQLDRFGITTPFLVDPAKDVSRAYDTLGRGHHADLPGHSFVLIDGDGAIAWRGDYPTMWVEPVALAAQVEAAR